MKIMSNNLKSYLVLALISMSTSWNYAQVGIGTTTPENAAVLDISSINKGLLIPRVDIIDLSTIAPVTGGSPAGLLVYNTNTTTQEGFYFWNGSEWTSLVDVSQITDNIYTTDGSLTSNRKVTQGNFDLNFDNSTLAIDGSENRIGIGTDTPESILHIKTINDIGDASIILESDADDNNENDNPSIEFKQANNKFRSNIGINNNGNDFNGALINSFYINSFGTGPNNDSGNIQFATGGTETTPEASTARMTILNNGNIGINTNSPTQQLSVAGTTGNTSGVWLMNSDYRIKNIGKDFVDGLDIINQINPVNFTYKPNAPLYGEGKPQIGIIAQELEKIAPYMISKSKGAGYDDLRTLNPQAFPYLLINAVQEQQLQIEERQKEIEELKTLVKMLTEKKKN